jgi:adenine-specific DNA-methyltransferase
VARFDETNWWKWGRRHHVSDAPRIYVNQQDAQREALLPATACNYDGAVLALFPASREAQSVADAL